MMDAYSNGKLIGQINVIKYQGKNMSDTTACAFSKMEAAYGKTLKVNSGFRTNNEQTYLYGCYQSKKCNSGNLAAKPGYSNHQNGIAVDISTGGGNYEWLVANAFKFGFIRTVQSEKWHWEYNPTAARPTWY
jgi:LAS superfamily LD-carboxypeptidase LdcB